MKTLILLLFFPSWSLASSWEGNILCEDFKRNVTPEKKSLFWQPKTFESSVIVGGEISAGVGPFDHFLMNIGLFKSSPQKFIYPNQSSHEILQKFLASSSANQASIVLAYDLLFGDIQRLKGRCSIEELTPYYLNSPLAKLIEKKTPIILGRIPFLFSGSKNFFTEEEYKCAININAVVNDKLCRPNKRTCHWMDTETFFAIESKNRTYFPLRSLMVSEAGSRALAQEICRSLEDSLKFEESLL